MRMVVAFGVGLALSLYAFQRVTDPQPARDRAREEAVVLSARVILRDYLGAQQDLQIVDPLAPKRAIGKVYVYPVATGFQVSGHYRRSDADTWHPFLMELDDGGALVSLAVRDDARDLRQRAASDSQLTTQGQR